MSSAGLQFVDLGRLEYGAAYKVQLAHVESVLAARPSDHGPVGAVLFVEHDPPVITVSRRPSAAAHLLTTPEDLRVRGVRLEKTDRGGDITYHGPGQLVVYPILDLQRLGLGLHEYMRLLERIVIDVCGSFGVGCERDCSATGVWVPSSSGPSRKICAMGVRVRRWVTLHGLALNVTTDLSHFDLIVPCGLHGRPVTSLERELGERCPSMQDVKARVRAAFDEAFRRQACT